MLHLQIWKVSIKFEIANRAFIAEITKSAELVNLIRIYSNSIDLVNLIRIRSNFVGLVTVLTFFTSSINLIIIRIKKEKF